MTERANSKNHRGPSRRWLVYFALFLTLAGGLAVAIGWHLPAYTDAEAAERIRAGLECEPGIPNRDQDHRCPHELWRSSMDGLRTGKWGFVDTGAGVLLSGLTWCSFLWWTRGRSLKQLSTPKHGLSIIALASAAWLLQIPAYNLSFMTELARGYDPPWSDSIIIPISEVQSVLLWLFLPYVAIWLLFLVRARLPAKVFSNVSGRPLVNAFWTAVTALLFAPVALVLIGAILDGPVMTVPLLWLTLWLLLCARSAALTRHQAYSGPIGADESGD
ncbi:hypothetical protein GGD63_007045 [Bradyrhizobium sp. cir1]|uniref:hypothetical protein n=1 Tax=Bradyrhizobium sp. cir1 TaxID=1445730 RepID=UPI0016063B89|nr:hypothetical protein [Bradyrhizobium sp. cir1]MBB4374216.1 hypothetical protein [Bradyrhizobium sp. cir1]